MAWLCLIGWLCDIGFGAPPDEKELTEEQDLRVASSDRYANLVVLRDSRSGTQYIKAVAGERCLLLGRAFGQPRKSVRRFWFARNAFLPFKATPFRKGKGITIRMSWVSPFELKSLDQAVQSSEYRSMPLYDNSCLKVTLDALPELKELVFPYCGMSHLDADVWKQALETSPNWTRRYLAFLLTHWILWKYHNETSFGGPVHHLLENRIVDAARECAQRSPCESLIGELDIMRIRLLNEDN